MERTDVLKIMAVLRGAYPQFYRDISRIEAEDTVNLWTDLFRGDDFALVMASVKSFIEADEKGFPPVPGQIKAKLRLISGRDEMTAIEAWNLVSKALKNGLYGAKEEFEKLPTACIRIVGSHTQLKEWAALDPDHVQSVISSHFQRAYRIISSREQEISRIPVDVKALIGSVSEKLGLED